jgi:hypothetical protein
VYVHRRNSDEKIFYIGKGKNKRYKSTSGRNQHWKNVALKHGWNANIVQSELSEEDSLELEEFMIEIIGLDNVCNKNYFNGGKSGYKHTEESKSKMSVSKIGKPTWNKGIKSIESSVRMIGTNNPMFGKKVIHTKETISIIRKKNGILVCDLLTGIFYDSMNEMAEALNIGRKTTNFKQRVHACETSSLKESKSYKKSYKGQGR